MIEQTDSQLLREYAGHRSEAAFGELVRRHVDLVYSAALRMTADAHLAQDVTQGAFVALAKNAAQLEGHPVLSGWLHRTARNIAAQTVRTNVRRQTREQEAVAMNDLLANQPDATWEEIGPLLDAALAELSEQDRDALMLRYFERKSAREMAERLGVSEEAAQKRVGRAVERLREVFSKNGVSVGAGGLVAGISANAVHAAPAGLAAVITTATLAATTITTTVVATKAIAMTTLQKSLVATVVAAAIGTGWYGMEEASRLRAELAALQARAAVKTTPAADAGRAALEAKIELLASQNTALNSALAQANADKAKAEEKSSRSTHLYEALAGLSTQDRNPTNPYPTMRHLMVGMGRFGRLSAELGKDESGLSYQEKAANKAARLKALDEIGPMLKAMKELDVNKPEGTDKEKEDPTDNITCMLYGMLNLSEQQFGQVFTLVQSFVERKKALAVGDGDPTPEQDAAFKQMVTEGEAGLKRLLTPEQAKIFDDVSPQLNLSAKSFHFNFSINEK